MPSQLMKLTTRDLCLHSRMGYGMISFYFPYAKTTQRLSQMYSTGQLSTWMQKTHCWPEKRSLRREKDNRRHGRTSGENQQGVETDRRIGTLNPPLGGSQASLHWLPQSTNSWCRLRTKEPWHFPTSWRETSIRGLETSIAAFIVITVMTHPTSTTWSNK